MDRAERQSEIEFLSENFKGSTFAVCADYRGLTVAQMIGVRRALGQSGAFGKVVKNTLARIALERAYQEGDSAEVSKFVEIFEGPNFLIFAKDDPVGSAKVAAKFEKDLEHFVIKGGWFEGRFIDKSGVVEFSNMASREETLSRLLCLISTPATQLVRLLQAPAQKLVRTLEAVRGKLEKGGE